MPVAFVTAAALVNELMEARDEKHLLGLRRQPAKVRLPIIDELGFVLLNKTGAELLFELISQRDERGSTFIASNLPFEEWSETFGTERLADALLDRFTHHVSILEMNGESCRLNLSKSKRRTLTHHYVCLTANAPRSVPAIYRHHAPTHGNNWPTFTSPTIILCCRYRGRILLDRLH